MSDIETPESRLRHQSLLTRHHIEEGVEKGITGWQGLIAQGCGEAFDYLLGERTPPSSDEATWAAAAHPLPANQPVISVNGNTAALCPGEIADLAAVVDADIEMNLFNRTDERMRVVAAHLCDRDAGEVKGLTGDGRIPGIDHECAKVDADGTGSADAVAVPLEDGDRAETLGVVDKVEIAVDLNLTSRSAQVAMVPTVDNIIRVVPNIAAHAYDLRGFGATCEELETTVVDFDADAALDTAERAIRAGDE